MHLIWQRSHCTQQKESGTNETRCHYLFRCDLTPVFFFFNFICLCCKQRTRPLPGINKLIYKMGPLCSWYVCEALTLNLTLYKITVILEWIFLYCHMVDSVLRIHPKHLTLKKNYIGGLWVCQGWFFCVFSQFPCNVSSFVSCNMIHLYRFYSCREWQVH